MFKLVKVMLNLPIETTLETTYQKTSTASRITSYVKLNLYNKQIVTSDVLTILETIYQKTLNSFTFDFTKSTKLVIWNLNTDCCLWLGISRDQEGHVLVLEMDNEVITS